MAKKSCATFSTDYKRNKTKQNKANYTLYAPFFPRFASEQVTVNFSESDRLIALFSSVVITRRNYFGIGFSTVIWKWLSEFSTELTVIKTTLCIITLSL